MVTKGALPHLQGRRDAVLLPSTDRTAWFPLKMKARSSKMKPEINVIIHYTKEALQINSMQVTINFATSCGDRTRALWLFQKFRTKRIFQSASIV